MEKILGQKAFPANREQLAPMLAYVATHAGGELLPEPCRLRIQLAVEEAAVNIVQYAYEQGGEITLRVLRKKRQFVVELIDSGFPYNPLLSADPDITAALAEREAGGLGIFFIRRFVDEVYYRRKNKQNILGLSMNVDKEEQRSKTGTQRQEHLLHGCT